MTKETLQKYCNNKGLKIKILCVKKCKEYGDYEIIYTFDLSYNGRDYSNIDLIIEPELDELSVNEEEFYFEAYKKQRNIKN